MIRLSLVLALLSITAVSAVASPIISLPDSGSYSYWVKGASGAIVIAPKSVNGVSKIDLKGISDSGDTLYVLDSHTGNTASVPLSPAIKAAALTLDQFHATTAAAQPAGTPTSTSSVPAPTSAPPPASSDTASSVGSIVSRVITGILSIAVLAGVIWFVRQLIQTKGQLLIEVARKTGIEVPNPDDLPQNVVEKDGKYEPPPVAKVQPVPSDAYKSARRSAGFGFLTSDDGTSYEVRGTSVSIGRDSGNDIVLADSSVSRKHARIESLADSAEIYDEGSANGVFINGIKVEHQILSPGDLVRIGQVALKYEK